jgi:putative intracellular protease/amidase
LGARDSQADLSPSFVVEDRNYLSARWPGDAYAFSRRFIEKLGGA